MKSTGGSCSSIEIKRLTVAVDVIDFEYEKFIPISTNQVKAVNIHNTIRPVLTLLSLIYSKFSRLNKITNNPTNITKKCKIK